MAKVIQLYATEEAVRAVRRRRGKFCLHREMEFCAEQRTITCNSCGAQLDHFEAFCTIVKDWDKVEELAREKRRLSQEIAALSKERKKLMASVSGMRRRQSKKPTSAGDG